MALTPPSHGLVRSRTHLASGSARRRGRLALMLRYGRQPVTSSNHIAGAWRFNVQSIDRLFYY